MLHRHVWANDTFSNWHDESRVHTKEEYAADTVFETKEGGSKKKSKLPEYSFNEYGEQVVTQAVELTEGELFAKEAAAAEAALKASEEALGEVEEILANSKKNK